MCVAFKQDENKPYRAAPQLYRGTRVSRLRLSSKMTLKSLLSTIPGREGLLEVRGQKTRFRMGHLWLSVELVARLVTGPEVNTILIIMHDIYKSQVFSSPVSAERAATP